MLEHKFEITGASELDRDELPILASTMAMVWERFVGGTGRFRLHLAVGVVGIGPQTPYGTQAATRSDGALITFWPAAIRAGANALGYPFRHGLVINAAHEARHVTQLALGEHPAASRSTDGQLASGYWRDKHETEARRAGLHALAFYHPDATGYFELEDGRREELPSRSEFKKPVFPSRIVLP